MRRLVLLCAAAVAAACSSDPGTGPGGGDTVFVVLPRGLQLAVGDTGSVRGWLVVGGTDTVAASTVWTSRDTAVATVSAGGLVTGTGAGIARVVGRAEGREDSVTVTVTAVTLPPPALQLIASPGTGALVHATAPAGDSSRVYVVAQVGIVHVIRNDTLLPTPFLDLRDRILAGGERGLLSIAFPPAFAGGGYVYVSYTDTLGDSRIERYTAAGPESADTASAVPILSLAQPYGNHNGGQIAFGPDGFLYVGFGDGGLGGDPLGAGQDRKTLLGKILRIDVNAGLPYGIPATNPFVADTGALPEIWAYGLRNPWRFSFDRQTGDLYIADVGQSAREEVNVQPAASPGGENYGWSVMEGSTCYNAASCNTSGKILPVAEYTHADGCSVTGGFVYRGAAVEILRGRYLYADYCSRWVRSFTWTGGQATEQGEWSALTAPANVTSFGEDARGEVYVLTGAGQIFRIVPN